MTGLEDRFDVLDDEVFRYAMRDSNKRWHLSCYFSRKLVGYVNDTTQAADELISIIHLSEVPAMMRVFHQVQMATKKASVRSDSGFAEEEHTEIKEAIPLLTKLSSSAVREHQCGAQISCNDHSISNLTNEIDHQQWIACSTV